ncbi:MAG: DinB family protein [Actinomycetota bacterium]|nr:DinB family protein [Actinomycetota bacterium]
MTEPAEPRPTPPRSDPQAPPPATKDWTWTLTRACPDCGFEAASVERDAIPALVRDAVTRLGDTLSRPEPGRRPDPVTWSPLEYACHARDVCRLFTERLWLMRHEAGPRFADWDQDETAVRARYWEQDAALVDGELREAGETVAAEFADVTADEWGRPGTRSNGSEFTVETLGRYLVHDLVHHVWDVRG